MSAGQRRTLARIHRKPPPVDLRWQEVVSALQHYGVEVKERKGSRVRLRKGNERIVVHRPHPGPQTGRETTRDISDFLRTAGVVEPVRGSDDE